jgi:hypothetical protein
MDLSAVARYAAHDATHDAAVAERAPALRGTRPERLK